MSALPDNIVEFKLPKRPRIKEKEPAPDRRRMVIAPIRAIGDRKLHEAGLRLLLAICSYANRAGITWVGQAHLGKDLGISKQAVSKAFKQLVELGYIEVMRKGWKGHGNQTVRVIFDDSIDAETAIAVTSSIEDTRPPYIKERQQMQQDNTIDPEGLKRIHDMIKGAIKPINPPPKEHTMPKSGDTVTVAKMKREIAQAKARREKHSQPPEVDNAEASHSQPDSQPPEVDPNSKELVLIDMYITCLDKKLKKYLEGLTELELRSTLSQLHDRCQAEGVSMPTGANLVESLLVMHADSL